MALDPNSIKWDSGAGGADASGIQWDDAKPERTTLGKVLGVPYDLVMGAGRGAANIGATILSPVDYLTDKITGKTDPTVSDLVTGKKRLSTNEERRKALNEFFQENADTNSLAYKAGELGTEIAGTAGVGGLLAKGVKFAPRLASALESGGFRLNAPAATTLGEKVGNAVLRVGGGATTGAASAALVDPDSAGAGAAIGGALPGGVKAAGALGSGLRSAAEHILGAMTGTGSESVKTAFQSGQRGAQDFLENMRGNKSFEDVVDQAKRGLQTMRQERSNAYRNGMVNIKGDKTVLDMQPILDSVNSIKASGNFKGKAINEKAAGIIDEIDAKVGDWAKSAPGDFHTPEGLDALKQAIGDIRDATQFGTPARRAADNVYRAIKGEIEAQAPTYTKVMKDYADASRELSEIERALSLGEKGSKDTAIRKLQSLMRNNAQSNYGNRLDLGKRLQAKGNVDLEPAIAGQSMSAMLPRGMVGAIEKAAMAASPFVSPAALMAAPFMSPRLVGEAAYGAGRLSKGAAKSLRSLGQQQVGGVPLSSLAESPALTNALIQAYAR